MTLRDLYKMLKSWPAAALATVLVALHPAAAFAGLAATATIASAPTSGGLYHYELVLTNTGSTTVGTFWYAWIPGAGFMTSMPTNIKSPANWTEVITNGVGSIQWVSSSAKMAPGATLSGFSFDSAMTPAQMAGPAGSGDTVDTSFVYIGQPLADPGFQLVPTAALAPSPVASSVLPGGRSVQVGAAATVYADMVNGGSSSLSGCDIALPSSAPAGLAMSYQTTDPTTNALTGTPNTPATIAGNNGIQTFVLSFTSSLAFTASGLPLVFQCSGTEPVTSIPGVNTVDLLFSSSPITDIIALAATSGGTGIVTVPQSTNGTGAFAVASVNAGAAGTVTAETDTGSATLPVNVFICQSDPSTAACMAPPSATVTLNEVAGATPTFSVFVTASAQVPLDPANSRIFLRFKDAGGTSHGSTSVAVQTN